MNTASRSILVGAALVMVLAGCQRKDEPAVTSSGQPAPNVTSNTVPMPQTSTPVPPLPEVAGKTAETTAESTAGTQKELTKQEESQAMPLPGQANSHSTTALDKSKSK